MYVCGITVYNYMHVGNARFMVVFDMVRRWLLASGYRVTYVRNITDIDDKIIKRAAAARARRGGGGAQRRCPLLLRRRRRRGHER